MLVDAEFYTKLLRFNMHLTSGSDINITCSVVGRIVHLLTKDVNYTFIHTILVFFYANHYSLGCFLLSFSFLFSIAKFFNFLNLYAKYVCGFFLIRKPLFSELVFWVSNHYYSMCSLLILFLISLAFMYLLIKNLANI